MAHIVCVGDTPDRVVKYPQLYTQPVEKPVDNSPLNYPVSCLGIVWEIVSSSTNRLIYLSIYRQFQHPRVVNFDPAPLL